MFKNCSIKNLGYRGLKIKIIDENFKEEIVIENTYPHNHLNQGCAVVDAIIKIYENKNLSVAENLCRKLFYLI